MVCALTTNAFVQIAMVSLWPRIHHLWQLALCPLWIAFCLLSQLLSHSKSCALESHISPGSIWADAWIAHSYQVSFVQLFHAWRDSRLKSTDFSRRQSWAWLLALLPTKLWALEMQTLKQRFLSLLTINQPIRIIVPLPRAIQVKWNHICKMLICKMLNKTQPDWSMVNAKWELC